MEDYEPVTLFVYAISRVIEVIGLFTVFLYLLVILIV
jgi:hypothetical protein